MVTGAEVAVGVLGTATVGVAVSSGYSSVGEVADGADAADVVVGMAAAEVETGATEVEAGAATTVEDATGAAGSTGAGEEAPPET